MKTLVDEVDASSQEQAQGIEQISKAIAQMDQVTQSTAANAEESASASEELNAQSQTLLSVVDRLQAMVGGDSQHHRANPQAGRRRRAQSLYNQRRAAAKTAPAHASAMSAAHNVREFPLDDSEFKEF